MSESFAASTSTGETGRKRALLRLWLSLTAGLGVATFLFYRFLWAGLFTEVPCVPSRGCALGPALSALVSFIFAAGPALLLAILLRSRGRYRQVFRIGRARLIGAAALAALAPVVIFSGAPWVLLAMLIFGVWAALATPAGPGAMAIPMLVGTFLVAVALAYPLSCLLVSGLRKRLVRLAGFTLVWWSAYCLVLMLFGLRTFVL